jgi:hypothetical protein
LCRFCTYNLRVKVGESFNIRDYVATDGTPVDFATLNFTYTEREANDPNPEAVGDWQLDKFRAGEPVTITQADAMLVGNYGGQGAFRLYLTSDDDERFVDRMIIHIGERSTLANDRCAVTCAAGGGGRRKRDEERDACLASGDRAVPATPDAVNTPASQRDYEALLSACTASDCLCSTWLDVARFGQARISCADALTAARVATDLAAPLNVVDPSMVDPGNPPSSSAPSLASSLCLALLCCVAPSLLVVN